MTVRVGVLGWGYWGPKLTRNLAEVDGAELVAVADPDPAARKAAAARLPGVRVTDDPAAVLDAPDVDAVCIATPVATHADLVTRALRAGKPVWVEKPFTATAAEAARLVDLARARDRVLMVDHTGAYAHALEVIGGLAADGHLGMLRFYDSVRISPGRFQPDGDVLWDLAAHDLGCLDVLVAERPVAVSATGAAWPPGGRESIAYLTLFHDSGFVAHVHASWLSPLKVRRVLVGGSAAMAVHDDLAAHDALRVYRHDPGALVGPLVAPPDRTAFAAGDGWTPRLDPTEPLRRALAHFVDCVASGVTPRTDGEAGLRVVRTLEAASVSLAARGAPVDLG